jgi:hypothetical protein
MKKLIYLTFLLLVSLVMVSCKDDEPTDPTVVPTEPTEAPTEPVDITVSVLHEEVINNQIHLSIMIANQNLTSAELLNLMNEVANEIYVDYFEEIDGRLFYLNISGFDALSSFNNEENPHYGTYVYGINLGIDKPGLSFVRINE